MPDSRREKAILVLALLDRIPRMSAMFARAVLLGALLTASAACITSTPGLTRASSDNPLITIGAGAAEIGGAWHAWYVIDRRTRTCWMTFPPNFAQLDCCALLRVSEAQPYITWTSCPSEVPPAIPGGPAPAAVAPAASPDAH